MLAGPAWRARPPHGPAPDPARPADPAAGRPVRPGATDLRVSLTDRCNLRCTYCMPAEGLDWMPDDQPLTDDEVVRLVTVAVRDLGVDEVRFTGGEPLLRKGLEKIVEAATALTHGAGPGDLADHQRHRSRPPRRRAGRAPGLDRLNVSLDTLDAATFETITRRDRLRRRARRPRRGPRAGLSPVKINTVLMRGINDDEAADLLSSALEHGYQLRFIEQMPLDAQGGWERAEMVTADEILAALSQRFTLTPTPPADRGAAPAERFDVDGRRRRPGRHGRHHRVGHPPVLRRLRPHPADRRRPDARLPVRPQRDRPAGAAARRRGRRRRSPTSGGRDVGQARRSRHRRPVVPAARPADERHRWLRVLQVRYYAGAAAAAGVEEEPVELPAGGDVAALRTHLARLRPALVPVLAVSTVLVDGVPASDPARSLDGATRVDVLPPFAGG